MGSLGVTSNAYLSFPRTDSQTGPWSYATTMAQDKRRSLLAPLQAGSQDLSETMSPLTLNDKVDQSPKTIDPHFLEAALNALERQSESAEDLRQADRSHMASPVMSPPSHYSSVMNTPPFGGSPSASSSAWSEFPSAFTPLSAIGTPAIGLSRSNSFKNISRGSSRRASKSTQARPSLGERRASSNSVKTGIYTPRALFFPSMSATQTVESLP